MLNLVNYSDDESSASDHSSPNENNNNETIQPQTVKKSTRVELMKPSSKSNDDKSKDENSISQVIEEEYKEFGINEIDLNSLNEADKVKLKRRKALEPYPYPSSKIFKIPSKPDVPVDESIQQKVDHFYKLKAEGMLFNNNIMKMKSFRNPNIYHKFVDYLNLEEVGTNFEGQNVFPKQGHYDQISKWQNDLEEEKINRNRNSKPNYSRNSTYLNDKFQPSASTSTSNSGGTSSNHRRKRWDQRH